jgi:hypothetical protein
VVTSAALSCLGEYSHANNAAKRMIGLYLLATGAQRQAITVLSTLGLSESYTNIVTKNVRRQRKPKLSGVAEDMREPQGEGREPEQILPPQRTGTLHQLSDAMREEAREIAKTGLFGTVYDNINMNLRSAEQVVGRHGMSQVSVLILDVDSM